MMRISLDQNQILPAYCIQFLNSFLGLSQLRLNVKHAVNQSSINQQDVKAVEVNLPPLPEQHEIVRRVEKLFASADRMEAHYTAARVQVEKLTPSLLNKAFSGELVEQDLTDESAAVLLERIRASKAPSPLPLSRRARGSITNPRPLGEGGRRPGEGNSTSPPAKLTPAGSIPLALLKAMKPGQEYSRADLTAATGITDADWTWAIRQLRESGQVVQIGERRGARYRRKE